MSSANTGKATTEEDILIEEIKELKINEDKLSLNEKLFKSWEGEKFFSKPIITTGLNRDDAYHEKITMVLKQIHPNRKISFDSLLLIGDIIFNIMIRISKLIVKLENGHILSDGVTFDKLSKNIGKYLLIGL